MPTLPSGSPNTSCFHHECAAPHETLCDGFSRYRLMREIVQSAWRLTANSGVLSGRSRDSGSYQLLTPASSSTRVKGQKVRGHGPRRYCWPAFAPAEICLSVELRSQITLSRVTGKLLRTRIALWRTGSRPSDTADENHLPTRSQIPEVARGLMPRLKAPRCGRARMSAQARAGVEPKKRHDIGGVQTEILRHNLMGTTEEKRREEKWRCGPPKEGGCKKSRLTRFAGGSTQDQTRWINAPEAKGQ
jgi:hypothetical protein